jgi:hypothetical protein
MTARAFRLKILEPTEAQILSSVLEYLAWNPRVAWAARINSGAVINPEGQYVPFYRLLKIPKATMPDIIGQLTDGRFFGIECKRHGMYPTPAQNVFLQTVIENRGLARVVSSIEQVAACFEEKSVIES